MCFLKCECVAICGLLEPLTFSNFVIIHTTRTHSYVLYQHTTRSGKIRSFQQEDDVIFQNHNLKLDRSPSFRIGKSPSNEKYYYTYV